MAETVTSDPSAPAAAPAAPAPAAGNLLSGLPAAPAAAPPGGMPSVPAPGGSDWRASLGDEYKDNTTLATIPDVKSLAKAYLDTKTLVGKKMAPPGPDAKPEEVANWRKLMGAPDKPEDYGSLMPEKFNKDLWSPELEAKAIAIAHKHHLPPAVLKEFAALQAEGTEGIYAREVAAAKEALEKGRAELRTTWGQDFDRRSAEATALAAALGIDQNDDIFVSRPDLLIKFAKAFPQFLGGDKAITGQPVSVSGGIQDRINSIRDSADYQGKNGAARQTAAAEQMRQLYAALSSTKAA